MKTVLLYKGLIHYSKDQNTSSTRNITAYHSMCIETAAVPEDEQRIVKYDEMECFTYIVY